MVLSARMILVFVAFSMAFFVFPFSPEIRAMHLARWSPCRFLTSFIWKVSKKRSSRRNMAMASSSENPNMKARKKSQVRCMADRSSVSSHSLISTVLFLAFILICSFMFLTTVSHIFYQLALRGVMRLGGIMTDCCSKEPFWEGCCWVDVCFQGASIICYAYIVESIYRWGLQRQYIHRVLLDCQSKCMSVIEDLQKQYKCHLFVLFITLTLRGIDEPQKKAVVLSSSTKTTRKTYQRTCR